MRIPYELIVVIESKTRSAESAALTVRVPPSSRLVSPLTTAILPVAHVRVDAIREFDDRNHLSGVIVASFLVNGSDQCYLWSSWWASRGDEQRTGRKRQSAGIIVRQTAPSCEGAAPPPSTR